MDAATKKQLQISAQKARISIIEGVHSAKAGHPGGSLSMADIITEIYFEQMNVDPKNHEWDKRDRFVLSKGHCSPALYGVLAEKGFCEVVLTGINLSSYGKGEGFDLLEFHDQALFFRCIDEYTRQQYRYQ